MCERESSIERLRANNNKITNKNKTTTATTTTTKNYPPKNNNNNKQTKTTRTQTLAHTHTRTHQRKERRKERNKEEEGDINKSNEDTRISLIFKTRPGHLHGLIHRLFVFSLSISQDDKIPRSRRVSRVCIKWLIAAQRAAQTVVKSSQQRRRGAVMNFHLFVKCTTRTIDCELVMELPSLGDWSGL